MMLFLDLWGEKMTFCFISATSLTISSFVHFNQKVTSDSELAPLSPRCVRWQNNDDRESRRWFPVFAAWHVTRLILSHSLFPLCRSTVGATLIRPSKATSTRIDGAQPTLALARRGGRQVDHLVVSARPSHQTAARIHHSRVSRVFICSLPLKNSGCTNIPHVEQKSLLICPSLTWFDFHPTMQMNHFQPVIIVFCNCCFFSPSLHIKDFYTVEPHLDFNAWTRLLSVCLLFFHVKTLQPPFPKRRNHWKETTSHPWDESYFRQQVTLSWFTLRVSPHPPR